jgi:hypothetical protein
MTRKEAMQFIESLLKIRNAATDELALESMGVYPEWKADTEYVVNARVRHNDLLYKARQEHISQEIYPPDTVPALWAVINESNKGTIDDPIPAVAGMLYEKDLYYIYNDVVYLCIREDAEDGTVLHFTPDQLVGNYFEVI